MAVIPTSVINSVASPPMSIFISVVWYADTYTVVPPPHIFPSVVVPMMPAITYMGLTTYTITIPKVDTLVQFAWMGGAPTLYGYELKFST